MNEASWEQSAAISVARAYFRCIEGTKAEGFEEKMLALARMVEAAIDATIADEREACAKELEKRAVYDTAFARAAAIVRARGKE